MNIKNLIGGVFLPFLSAFMVQAHINEVNPEDVMYVQAMPVIEGVTQDQPTNSKGELKSIFQQTLGYQVVESVVDDCQHLVQLKGYTIHNIQDLGYYIDKNNMPAGIVRLIAESSEYRKHIICDDSGSMSMSSTWYDEFLRIQRTTSRFEELKHRLTLFVQYFASVAPSEELMISFLNRADVLKFTRGNKTTVDFENEMKREIEAVFSNGPSGGTPIYQKLNAIYESSIPTMVYLFCDGEDNGGSEKMKKLIINRDSKRFPTTLVSVTSDDASVEWMKEIDNEAQFTSEIDDIVTELGEIIKAHGIGILYIFGANLEDSFSMSPNYLYNQALARNVVKRLQEGQKLDAIIEDKMLLESLLNRYAPIWAMAHLFSAIDPKGLDSLDEEGIILSAALMSEFMGVDFTEQSSNITHRDYYQLYLQYHPVTLGFAEVKKNQDGRKFEISAEILRSSQPSQYVKELHDNMKGSAFVHECARTDNQDFVPNLHKKPDESSAKHDACCVIS